METWVESAFCPDKHIINITEEHLFPQEDAHTGLRVFALNMQENHWSNHYYATEVYWIIIVSRKLQPLECCFLHRKTEAHFWRADWRRLANKTGWIDTKMSKMLTVMRHHYLSSRSWLRLGKHAIMRAELKSRVYERRLQAEIVSCNESQSLSTRRNSKSCVYSVGVTAPWHILGRYFRAAQ